MDFLSFLNPAVILGLALIWLTVLTFSLFSLWRDYARLVKGVTAADLRGIWRQHLESLERANVEIREVKRAVEKIESADKKHLQRLALVRFNPFADTGGNQSFVLSLLDDEGRGVVLSSLHGREGTRVYAKNITDFKNSDFELSTEEKEALEDARTS